MSDATVFLTELPAHPTGWTTHLVLHLNFGRGKGSAVYEIHDEQGRKVEGIARAYDTRPGGGSGFQLHLDDSAPGYLTWPALRAAYAKAVAKSDDS